MNNPHVVALIYRVEHGPTVDFSDAKPLDYDRPDFRVHLEKGRARFELKKPYPGVKKAREVVEPFARAWELSALLERRRDIFSLRYDKPEVVNPPGKEPLVASITLDTRVGAVLIGQSAEPEKESYPPPPSNFAIDVNVELLASRYRLYQQGRDTIAAMAYFCLTVLEAATMVKKGRTRAAAARYQISRKVLEKVRELATTKGGGDARKAEGVGQRYTHAEITWIAAVIIALIRRAAEVAYDPGRNDLKTITMADLPPL